VKGGDGTDGTRSGCPRSVVVPRPLPPVVFRDDKEFPRGYPDRGRNITLRSASPVRVAIVLVSLAPVRAGEPRARKPVPQFVPHRVGAARYEPCGMGNFNKDGDLDRVVSGKWGGPVWFENKSK
jgi:hypothetical protein